MDGFERTRIRSALLRSWEGWRGIKNCTNLLLSIKWMAFQGISHILIKSTLDDGTPNWYQMLNAPTAVDGKGFYLIRLRICGGECHYKINENTSTLTALIKHKIPSILKALAELKWGLCVFVPSKNCFVSARLSKSLPSCSPFRMENPFTFQFVDLAMITVIYNKQIYFHGKLFSRRNCLLRFDVRGGERLFFWNVLATERACLVNGRHGIKAILLILRKMSMQKAHQIAKCKIIRTLSTPELWCLFPPHKTSTVFFYFIKILKFPSSAWQIARDALDAMKVKWTQSNELRSRIFKFSTFDFGINVYCRRMRHIFFRRKIYIFLMKSTFFSLCYQKYVSSYKHLESSMAFSIDVAFDVFLIYAYFELHSGCRGSSLA